MSRLGAAAAVAVFVLGALLVPAAPGRAHGGAPDCAGEITAEDARKQRDVSCIFHFVGTPIVVEGEFSTDHAQLRSDVHVGVTAVLQTGERRDLPIECTDPGRPGDPRATCRVVWEPTGTGGVFAQVPVVNDIVYLLCEAHSHARESRLFNRTFGPNAGGRFQCTSGWPADGGGPPVPDEPPSADGPAAVPMFLAVPVNIYATGNVTVVRDVAAHVPPSFVNLDQNLHDIVALDARRADGSARWCSEYDSGTCPLFWSPLIGAGQSVVVEGLSTAPPGAYRFYCSIHPDMLGIVTVR